jgi:spore germination protein KA
MSVISVIKNIVIYKEPKNNERFELLEDEQEDMKNGEAPETSETAAQNFNENEENILHQPSKNIMQTLKRVMKNKKQEDTPKVTNGITADQNQDNRNNVSKDLKKNLQKMKQEFHFSTNQDIVIREFKVVQKNNAFIVYIDGMVDKNTINDYILRQLMAEQKNNKNTKISVDYITDNLLAINQVIRQTDYKEIIKQILNGLTALFVEGNQECVLIESRGYEKRSVSTPLDESVIKGPQEAFTENLRTNLTLVRKIIKNKDLVTEMMPIGKAENTACAIMHIKGITNPKIVQEVKRRISSIDIDFIAGDGGLDQLIEDHPFSLFPQILSTERPDRTASFLMDGKVAIICDGSPYASIVPITFFRFFHSAEDGTLRWQFGTFLRLIRMVAAFFAMFLPGLFIALTLYHQEVIPTELLFSFSKAKENIPIPIILELLVMELSFELMREAGIRLPGAIGQSLGIIGAIVLGSTAVAAGIVSPILIMVVSITGLCGFAIPNFSIAFGVRIMRFIFIFFGVIAGFYGIAAGIFIFGGLACSMKSFGVPYFSPVAPKTKANHDIGIMVPPWTLKERPDFLNTNNRKRTNGTVRGWIQQAKRGNGK